MLKIVHAPAEVLTKGVRPVAKIDKKIKQLVYEMEETLIAQVDPQGVGLAAPQVGVDLSIFIIKPTLNADTEVFINPKILEIVEGKESSVKSQKKTEAEKDIKLEGCLSIPKIWGPVTRSAKVHLEYQDLTGEKRSQWFTGFKAVIIQHETDHLNGILFTERVLEQKNKLYEEKNGELEVIQ